MKKWLLLYFWIFQKSKRKLLSDKPLYRSEQFVSIFKEPPKQHMLLFWHLLIKNPRGRWWSKSYVLAVSNMRELMMIHRCSSLLYELLLKKINVFVIHSHLLLLPLISWKNKDEMAVVSHLHLQHRHVHDFLTEGNVQKNLEKQQL